MPRRASGSQTQTQSQRASGTNGRRRREEEEEEENEDEEDEEMNGEEEEEPTQTQGGSRVENLRKKASALAKMALLGEYSRRPLKRVDFAAAILNGNSRAFPHVLREAQEILRSKFGMELVELRPRTKVDASGTALGGGSSQRPVQPTRKRKQRALNDIEEEEEDEVDEDGEEEGTNGGEPVAKKQKKQPPTGLYILRNALPLELRKLLSTPNPLPGFDVAGHRIALSQDDNADSGALIQWEKGDGSHGHPGLFGIRALILCVILAQGKVISDDDLHAYLKRVGLLRDTEVPYHSSDTRESLLTLDKYLDLLAKQNYLEKVKSAQTAPGAEGHKIEWRWGSREAEWSEKAAHQWIQAILIDSQEETFDDEDEPATQRRGRDPRDRNTAEKARKQLAKDIANAAGSELTGDL